MRSLSVAPSVVAYCEPYMAPWQHVLPAGAAVELVLDDGPIVARIRGAGFAPYALNRRGDTVALPSPTGTK